MGLRLGDSMDSVIQQFYQVLVPDHKGFHLKLEIGRKPTLIILKGFINYVVYDLWFEECLFTLNGLVVEGLDLIYYRHKIFIVNFADYADKDNTYIELYWDDFSDHILGLKC